AGVCGGTAVAGCAPYLKEGFESCPDGWTLMKDWQCGTPTAASPVTPHTGNGVLATQLAGVYHINQSYASTTADSPIIDLSAATAPAALFWAWSHTEIDYDGWNVQVSTDGGQTFNEAMGVTPPYVMKVAGELAYTGDESALGWQPYFVDLTPFI